MNSLKQSDSQYRNIGGKYFECHTSDPGEFTNAKKECKAAGLSFRIINGQFYRETTKQLQSTEEAIETVKENNREYYDLAIVYTERWIKEQFKPFTSEDLSSDMYLVLGKPQQPRILGAIFQYLKKKDLIKHHGYATCKSKDRHSRPISVWITVRYSKQQSNNRSKLKSKNKVEVVQIDAFKQK
jgi:hypothetical protein